MPWNFLFKVFKISATRITQLDTNWSYTLSEVEQTNSVALSPQANWATATCQRNLVPTFVDRGVSRGQHPLRLLFSVF
jgi:hypothetical protein